MKKTRTLLTRLFIIAAAALFCYLIYIYVVAPYSAKWRALYGKEDYPKGYSIHGIDISHHQGTIDWEKLSKAEIDGEGNFFVIIKATEVRSL